MKKRPKVLFLTNIPAPYREKMHELLAANPEINYRVCFCTKIEPNREWKFEQGKYHRIFLKESSDAMVHNNRNVFKYLNQYQPDVIIATSFNPTMLYGFIWSLLNRKKFIPYIDGTQYSESSLTRMHRLVRKFVFHFSPAFVGPSIGSAQMFKSYKIADNKIFRSCLCIENNLFTKTCLNSKKYDIMFSGQMIDRKMPLFFVEVAKKIKETLGFCNVLIVGNGPLKNDVLNKMRAYNINFNYPGFIQPGDLPEYYKQSKVFLFPTKNDPWGIVVNEACASGVPVITCENAGVAHDLIIHGENGYILPLNIDLWAEHAIKLLKDEVLLNRFAQNAHISVQSFTSEEAASGLLKSINYALSNTSNENFD